MVAVEARMASARLSEAAASAGAAAVLPDWVLREARYRADIATLPVMAGGERVTRRLFAATRSEDTQRPFIAHLVRLARQEAVKVQRTI